MTGEFIISVIGVVLGAMGFAYAVVQGARARQIRMRAEADLWFSIRTVRSIIGKLEESSVRKTDGAVAQVYGKSTELFRHLLKEAILAEPNFDEETITKWKAAGKLASAWQVAQARNFLQTNKINLYVTHDNDAETGNLGPPK